MSNKFASLLETSPLGEPLDHLLCPGEVPKDQFPESAARSQQPGVVLVELAAVEGLGLHVFLQDEVKGVPGVQDRHCAVQRSGGQKVRDPLGVGHGGARLLVHLLVVEERRLELARVDDPHGTVLQRERELHRVAGVPLCRFDFEGELFLLTILIGSDVKHVHLLIETRREKHGFFRRVPFGHLDLVLVVGERLKAAFLGHIPDFDGVIRRS